MLRIDKISFFSLLFLFLISSFTYCGEIDQVTLAVKDLDQAAKLFSQKGFTLKVPHEYHSGHQNGLKVQSIRFLDGTYLQLVSVQKAIGELSKWYQKFLEKQEGGAFLVLKAENLKELEKEFKKIQIDSLFSKAKDHHWLSFKTGSPLQNISFIDYRKSMTQKPGLTNHENLSLGIKTLTVRARGDTSVWAKVLTLSDSLNSHLIFSPLTYQDGVFISEIVLRTKRRPTPSAFSLGKTKILFESE